MKEDIRFKRIVAYLLDIMLLSLVTMILSNINFLNPSYNQYNDAYNNYQETYTKYQNQEITDEEYEELYYQYNYEISKYGISYTVTNIVIVVLYFGVFQLLNKGQTLGKKIMNIKVVSNKKKELNFLNYLIRILLLNGILFNIVPLISIWMVNYSTYYYISYYSYQLNYFVEMLILCTVFINKDHRGLHDKLAGTKVIKGE